MGTGGVRVSGPPEFGAIGGLTNLQPRADFRPGDHERLIEAQASRLAWARAARCPCPSANAQTQQPRPDCPMCRGRGWTFFGPQNYSVPTDAGELDFVQRRIVAEHGGAVIRGLMIGVERRDLDYGKLGPWVWGSALVTVRPQNVLGRWDRLVDLDSEMAFTEVVAVTYTGAIPDPLATRYPVIAVDAILAYDGTASGIRYRQNVEFSLDVHGVIRWRDGYWPPNNTRVAIHYLVHQHWRVMEQPHAMRRTQQFIRQGAAITTPQGTPTALPIQALIRLEYLTEDLPE